MLRLSKLPPPPGQNHCRLFPARTEIQRLEIHRFHHGGQQGQEVVEVERTSVGFLRANEGVGADVESLRNGKDLMTVPVLTVKRSESWSCP